MSDKGVTNEPSLWDDPDPPEPSDADEQAVDAPERATPPAPGRRAILTPDDYPD